MRKFDEIKATFPVLPYAKKIDYTTYYGYAGGKVIGEFKSIEDAKKAGAATTEKTFDKEAYDVVNKAYLDNVRAIVAAWEAELRTEYPGLSDEMYSAIYSEAYERGHSYGYDEVAIHFDDYYDFAMKVIAINKKE